MAHIIFEGPDSSGKTSVLKKFEDTIKNIVVAHHPGSTPVGQKIRTLVLKDTSISAGPKTEQILMAADYCQFLETVLKDTEKRFEVSTEPSGEPFSVPVHIFSDRSSVLSSFIYGSANGANVEFLIALWDSIGVPVADLLIIFKCPFEVCLGRGKLRGEKCKIEDRGIDFMKIIHHHYEMMCIPGTILGNLASRYAKEILVVDSSVSEEQVFAKVKGIVNSRVSCLAKSSRS